jgi:hypothetical protein
MKKQSLRFLTLTLIGILIYSCQNEQELINKEETAEVSIKEQHLNSDEKEIILGNKIDNPYSVENMQKAFSNLMNAKSKNSNTLKKTGETINISVNHHYVRFWCNSIEEKDKLTNLDIKFSDFPLNQEIEEEGEFFIDEDVTTENYEGSWVYTSILANFDYETLGLKYEILEDLFLFEEAQGEDTEEDNSLLAKSSNSQISFYEELEKEAFRITGNLEKETAKNKENLQQKCWFFCSGRTQPKGTIKVYNTVTGNSDPVVGVKIRTYRWFVWGHAYTNENGYYKINKKYRGNPWYSIDFDNPSNKIKIYSTWLSLSDATYRAWTQSKNGYNKTFYTNSYGWRFSTVNNAVVKYRKYCKDLGIGTFNSKMRINVTSGSGSASAPMLKHTYGLIGFNSHASLSNFFINSTLGAIVNSVGFIVRLGLLPDIWIQGNASQGTDGVYSTTFHEMAHSSHFAKVGSSYWSRYISYIITYGSYGDGNGRNAGICALGEAWGYHMGNFLTIREFGTSNNIITQNGFENFDPIKRPGTDIVRYGTPTYRWEGWIPAGLMNDIIDTNRDIIHSGLYDDVSGYTIKNIYDALDSDVLSPQAFRDRLLRENRNLDETDLRKLFATYYWN